MLNYLSYFFDPSHLFALRPPTMHPRAITILAVIFGALVIMGIVSNLSARGVDSLKAKGLKRLTNLGLTMGSLGYLYLFFAWQRAALLGARFWLLGLGLITVGWLLFIIKYLIFKVPARRKEINERRRFEQYLP